ncbi:helix-turn-helix domain-containing protein, partial [bacterium]|nr:helix-turn-helix domain-containing protein [bacterium]
INLQQVSKMKGGGIMAVSRNFGNFFKQRRRELGLTLREFCRINGFDPGNISKLERGLLPPPSAKEKRLQYANALGIREGTDDWLTFCDLATTSAGKIPQDIVSDEEVMNALPVLFRTIRRRSLDEKDLKKLIDSVRRELR